MISPQAVVEAARKWVGTPFHHGARVLGVGVDCIGVMVGVAVDLGMPLQDRAAYPLRPNGTLRRELMAQLRLVPASQPGDILMMAFDQEPHHVAILTGPTIIHAHAKARRCIEQPYDAYWRSKVRGVFRYPGVSDEQ